MTTHGTRAELVRRTVEAAAGFAASAQLRGQERGRAAGLALHSADATVLALLRVHGPLTPRELARRAGISSSGTVTGAIDRLERAGWTSRTPCQVDRRKVFITLTEAAGDDPDDETVRALDRCTDDQLAAIGDVLERLSRPEPMA